MSEGFTWQSGHPQDGQAIEVFSTATKEWYSCTFWEDGIDGAFEFPDGDIAEVEEYGKTVFPRWRAAGVAESE